MEKVEVVEIWKVKNGVGLELLAVFINNGSVKPRYIVEGLAVDIRKINKIEAENKYPSILSNQDVRQ